MIRTRYAIKLARTKLRSKRGVLAASTIVASLLFAALIACIVVFTGAEKSALNFVEEANNDRYLVKVTPVIPNDKIRFSADPTLEEIQQIKAFEEQYYNDLRAKYKEFGLTYDESSEIPALIPAPWKSPTLPEQQRVSIDWQSPVIATMIDERYAAYAETATNKFSDLQAIGKNYNASGYYLQQSTGLPGIPNLRLIQDGKEDFGSTEMRTGDLSTYGYYVNSIYNGQYNFEDTTLLSRYLLNQESDLKGIPVVVSAQEAASLFGDTYDIGAEPESEAGKTAWLKDIQTKLNGYVYQSCYRNSTERSLLDKIQRDYAEMAANKDNADYVKPNLLYDYPKSACGNIGVREDTRTASEKNADVASEEARKKLGTYVAPRHKLLSFQIVGVVNAQPYTEYASSIENYIKSLITSGDTSRAATIPFQMYETLPEDMKFDDLISSESLSEVGDDFSTRILEFQSIEEARAFMNNETCPGATMDCDKKFTADPYGSNYLILDEISTLFKRIIGIALPVLLGLATIIIWFTISRIMTENRRETAVYRAMGARRIDVAAIYIVYVLFVAMRIAIVSVITGLLVAYGVNYLYGNQLTDVAISSFGIITEALHFSLFDVSSPLLWSVVGLVFVVSLVASIQPLIRNVLRSPVQDMREE